MQNEDSQNPKQTICQIDEHPTRIYSFPANIQQMHFLRYHSDACTHASAPTIDDTIQLQAQCSESGT